MIRLVRPPLSESEERLLARRSKNPRQLPKPIRERLRSIQHGKCAYCEGRLAQSPLHVDHYRPVAGPHGRADLIRTWTNLIGACAACNGHKGDRFDPTCPPLNPYEDEPSEHLEWDQHDVRGTTPRGRETVQAVVKLDRPDLVESRRAMHQTIMLLAGLPSNPRAVRLLEEACRDDEPYAAMVRAALGR